MAREQPIRRLMFQHAVNTPGDGMIVKRNDGRNEQRIIGPSTEDTFPTRGAIGGKPDYRLYFSEGWVFIEHPHSRVKMRYPMSMVREVTFAEDVPSAEGLKAVP